MVYYGVGSPNMQTYTIFESDIVDGNIDVVIEAIDEITLDAPSITSSSSKFDVTGQINADAQSSSFRAMSIKPMSVSSATATLFQRHKVKNKWSGWTKLKTATVTGSSVKFKKLKLAKGSYQLQVRRTDMSIGSEIQALKVR
jgi:hypothetical protein